MDTRHPPINQRMTKRLGIGFVGGGFITRSMYNRS
jgi:hypothetical protein